MDSHQVAPDHVTFHVWPRYAMKARAAQSALCDYYYPDARVVLAPASFVVSR